MSLASVGIPLYIETNEHLHSQESWEDFRGKAYGMRDDSLEDHSSGSSLWMLDGSSSSHIAGYHGRRQGTTTTQPCPVEIKDPFATTTHHSSSRSRRRSSISSSNGSVCSTSSRRSSSGSGGQHDKKKKQKQRGSLKSLLGSTGPGTVTGTATSSSNSSSNKKKPVFPKNTPRTMMMGMGGGRTGGAPTSRMGKIDKHGRFVAAKREREDPHQR